MAGTPGYGILKELHTFGFTKWGFVIYRCTYDNDEAWNTFLHNFREKTKDNLKEKGEDGNALLNCLEWKVMEDKDKFNNASKTTIREAFQEWVDQTTRENEQPDAKFDPKISPHPRYRYCIQVDIEALRSLVPSAFGVSQGVNEQTGFVNLIKRRWPNWDFLPEDVRQEIEREEEEEGFAEDDYDDEAGLSDVEGCTDDDVGFMRLCPDYTYPAAYMYLLGQADWDLLYVRPPQVGPR